MSETNGTASMWKWICTCIITAAISGIASAYTFRAKPRSNAEIKEVLREAFTDISDGKGMYAREGRPRIKQLEATIESLQTLLQDMQKRQIRMEAILNKDRQP